MARRQRFPRLAASSSEIRRGEPILRATYNSVAKNKGIGGWHGWYDVYKSKFADRAKHCFPILADRLVREKIDPSLYVKVMSKYGRFEETKLLPHPAFLYSDKAIAVFRWLVEKERQKFSRSEDWKRHLDSNSRRSKENPKNISYGIKKSLHQIRDGVKNLGFTEGEAAVLQMYRLSPWYMAISPEFRKIDGMSYLPEKDRRIVENCVSYFIKHEDVFHEAFRTYRKIRKLF